MSECRIARIIAVGVIAVLAAGCGGGNYSAPTSTPSPTPTPTPPVTAGVLVVGQYDLVLTSSDGHGTTNIYANFTQTGTRLTGSEHTLVCPSNDLSQCEGEDVTSSPITPSGTVSGPNVTVTISFPVTAGTDTVTMTGTALLTNLSGTYTDSLGDAGTWTGSTAVYPVASPPGVYDFTGSFNSTLNPLLIAPTLSLELGRNTVSNDPFSLKGSATIMNSPCIGSLTFSGQAMGDAFSLTDQTSEVSLLALPNLPLGNGFNFSYKFDPAAPHCTGDFGRGVITLSPSPFDY